MRSEKRGKRTDSGVKGGWFGLVWNGFEMVRIGLDWSVFLSRDRFGLVWWEGLCSVVLVSLCVLCGWVVILNKS